MATSFGISKSFSSLQKILDYVEALSILAFADVILLLAPTGMGDTSMNEQ
jgi:hypothetical protein